MDRTVVGSIPTRMGAILQLNHSRNLRPTPEENLRIVHLVGMTSCPDDVPLKKSIEFTPSGLDRRLVVALALHTDF